MKKAVVLRNVGQSAYVMITQLTTIVVLGPKELTDVGCDCDSVKSPLNYV